MAREYKLHQNCNHPRTPGARRRCREGLEQPELSKKEIARREKLEMARIARSRASRAERAKATKEQ